MLAKIWKKLLLAICIIAILFNITAKLVNRISLEKAISSSPEGVNIREILNITEEERTVESNQSVSRYKTIEEVEAERAAAEAEQQQAEEQALQAESQEVVVEEGQEPATEEGGSSSIIDMITDRINDTDRYNDLLN